MKISLLLIMLAAASIGSAQTARLIPGAAPVTDPIRSDSSPASEAASVVVPMARAGSERPASVSRPAGPASSSFSREDMVLAAKLFLASHPDLPWTLGWVASDHGMDPALGKGTLVFFEKVSQPQLHDGDVVLFQAAKGPLLERLTHSDPTSITTSPDHDGTATVSPVASLLGRVVGRVNCNAAREGHTSAFMEHLVLLY